jgi:hypothetical protein
MRRAILIEVICVIVTGSGPSWAWGPLGHRASGFMAERLLRPEVRREVRALLEPGETLADASQWADEAEVRDRMPRSNAWHYVNVPLGARAYESRHCDDRRSCVVEKIREYRRILSDRRRPARERREALRWLVHLIQDVHQPLHVGDNRDRGGNTTQVLFEGRSYNLHYFWDNVLVREANRDERAWLDDLTEMLSARNLSRWSAGEPEDWANESLEAARRAYTDPVSGRVIRSGDRLGDAYFRAVEPIVRERLAQAAVRTALVLNEVFSTKAESPRESGLRRPEAQQVPPGARAG